MSHVQTEISIKPKLVINPLALIMGDCNYLNDKVKDSYKKKIRKRLRKIKEDLLIQDDSHESVISIDSNEACDVVKETTTLENVKKSVGKLKKKNEEGKVKELQFLYQSVGKEPIRYSLRLIKDFILNCDSENIVFTDKFSVADVRFLGLLFDVEQAFVEKILDKIDFNIYNELNELVQNKPFRIFWLIQSRLRRIIFLKNYIASDNYETSSFVKINPLDTALTLPESEMNMAPKQTIDLHELVKSAHPKLTSESTVDLTIASELAEDCIEVIDIEGSKGEKFHSKNVPQDRKELPPAKKPKGVTKKQVSQLRKVERAKLADERTNTLREGLETPVQCFVAERIMRNMGWDGGALGVCGTGITEPIKPNIDRKASYGLGHQNAIKESKTNDNINEEPNKKKSRKENNRHDKRSQKRMEKLLKDSKLREEMRKHQQEVIFRENKPELVVKASYGLGHQNAIKESKTDDNINEEPNKKKSRKENNRRDKRTQKRMEKLLEDIKVLKEMRKHQREAVFKENKPELVVVRTTEDFTKKRKERSRKGKEKGKRFHLTVLESLLEFVCDDDEHEMCFDQPYNEKRHAQIHKLVDHINEGGCKSIPSEWNKQLVEEICECTDSYLVSESSGKDKNRQLSIYKLPLESVMFVNEEMLLFRADTSSSWNHLEVVVGNLLEMMVVFLQHDVKDEIRFTGQYSTKTRNLVNKFLKQLQAACKVKPTATPVTEMQKLMHDAYKWQPNLSLQIMGQVLKQYQFNSMCAKIIKVSKEYQEQNGGMIVIH